MISKFVLFCAVVLTSLQAHGFQLGDHETITRQAVAEFISCFPQYKDRIVADWLVNADLDEDQNLIIKELFFSHYYNPTKKLGMFRGTSLDRINNLAPTLQQCRADVPQVTFDELDVLGHAIHHLQDMNVPAHVVPVKHSFWDGFETYSFNGDISSGWACSDITALTDKDMQSILTNTAEETLTAIQSYQVEVTNDSDHSTKNVNGTSFWIEAQGDDFGSYGTYVFGEIAYTETEGTSWIQDSSFSTFKQQQMKTAVRATLRGMVWALQPQ